MKKKYIILSIVTLTLLVSFLGYSKYLKTTNIYKKENVNNSNFIHPKLEYIIFKKEGIEYL